MMYDVIQLPKDEAMRDPNDPVSDTPFEQQKYVELMVTIGKVC